MLGGSTPSCADRLAGPCEVPSCVDPRDVDDNGHGTHVAGIAALVWSTLLFGSLAMVTIYTQAQAWLR